MKKIVPENAVLLPENAKSVYSGVIFDIYQWPQTMFDGSEQVFEMLKRPDTVQVIVVRGDDVLLINDEQPGRSPRLHFPGGRVDEEDKSWETAAIRELREETGLTCANWRLIDVKQPIIKIEWFTPVYLVNDITEEAEQQLDGGGERISLQWTSFSEVRDRVLDGREQTIQYLIPLFTRVKTIADLLALPEFKGKTVELK